MDAEDSAISTALPLSTERPVLRLITEYFTTASWIKSFTPYKAIRPSTGSSNIRHTGCCDRLI